MLKIVNLHVFVENSHIVKGVSLTIKSGEVHVMMGPNGSGKSSFAYGLMGHPSYKTKEQRAKSKEQKTKTQNGIFLDGKNILEFSPDERARRGLFLAFQHPISIPGVSVANFLRIAKDSLKKEKNQRNSSTKAEEIKSIAEFNRELKEKAQKLGIKETFLKRSINEGFSGGEKKKLEMLQLAVLMPKFAIIDEIDTGLDVDALKLVARGIKQVVKSCNPGVLLITHYQRILHLVEPDFVHIMIDGRIVKSGDYKLAEMVEKRGYKVF